MCQFFAHCKEIFGIPRKGAHIHHHTTARCVIGELLRKSSLDFRAGAVPGTGSLGPLTGCRPRVFVSASIYPNHEGAYGRWSSESKDRVFLATNLMVWAKFGHIVDASTIDNDTSTIDNQQEEIGNCLVTGLNPVQSETFPI